MGHCSIAFPAGGLAATLSGIARRNVVSPQGRLRHTARVNNLSRRVIDARSVCEPSGRADIPSNADSLDFLALVRKSGESQIRSEP